MIPSAISLTVSMGTAKKIPAERPFGEYMVVFMPMTSPLEFRSGPPLLPGLVLQSV